VHPTFADQGGVVVEHGARLAADPYNVVGVRRSDDLLDGCEIVAGGASEARPHDPHAAIAVAPREPVARLRTFPPLI